MNINSTSGGILGAVTGMVGIQSPFTVSQWQELEHQALIYKYMMAGLPVPPDLVLPIQKSFESISQRFFHHPTSEFPMSYCSFYGKKVDPEPGRCRRTDGKKWRCSKDAYPDSKYCERHMHRGRNRSRKPVESQTMTQSSSTATSLAVTAGSTATGSFQNLPVNAFGNSQGTGSGTDRPQYYLDSIPYGIPNKEYRYVEGIKSEGGEHGFFSEASGSNRVHVESSLRNTWDLMPNRVAATFSISKSSSSSMLQNDYSHQHSFLSSSSASALASGEEGVKQGQGQPVRPFFDEWPKSRES